MVEQGNHNPLVGGSNPSSATTLRLRLRVAQPHEADLRRSSARRSPKGEDWLIEFPSLYAWRSHTKPTLGEAVPGVAQRAKTG